MNRNGLTEFAVNRFELYVIRSCSLEIAESRNISLGCRLPFLPRSISNKKLYMNFVLIFPHSKTHKR